MHPFSNQERPNTSSALPFFAIGALALVTGVMRQNTGAIALGVAAVLLPVVVAIALRRVVSRLVVERSAPGSAFEGDSIEVKMRLRNRSRLPVFFPHVTEVFHPELHSQKIVLFPERVDPGETAEASYRGHCLLPRGIYNVGPSRLLVSDPFGWFTVRRELSLSRQLKVYPRVQDVVVRERVGECVDRIVETATRPRIGNSNEILHVREYRVGDPVRNVHWRLTAHRGFPVVREMTRTSSGDIEVFVDNNGQALAGIGRTSTLEYSVKLTASLAARALRAGHRIGVRVGDDADLSIAPGSGQSHFLALLDRLVRIKPSGETPFVEALASRSRLVSSGSTVVVTIGSYLYEDHALESLLRSWRGRGLPVIAVLFDTETFQHVWSRADVNAPLSTQDFAGRLRALGIESYTIPCGAQLSHVFHDGAESFTPSTPPGSANRGEPSGATTRGKHRGGRTARALRRDVS